MRSNWTTIRRNKYAKRRTISVWVEDVMPQCIPIPVNLNMISVLRDEIQSFTYEVAEVKTAVLYHKVYVEIWETMPNGEDKYTGESYYE